MNKIVWALVIMFLAPMQRAQSCCSMDESLVLESAYRYWNGEWSPAVLTEPLTPTDVMAHTRSALPDNAVVQKAVDVGPGGFLPELWATPRGLHTIPRTKLLAILGQGSDQIASSRLMYEQYPRGVVAFGMPYVAGDEAAVVAARVVPVLESLNPFRMTLSTADQAVFLLSRQSASWSVTKLYSWTPD